MRNFIETLCGRSRNMHSHLSKIKACFRTLQDIHLLFVSFPLFGVRRRISALTKKTIPKAIKTQAATEIIVISVPGLGPS
jgi:hypothetical protein